MGTIRMKQKLPKLQETKITWQMRLWAHGVRQKREGESVLNHTRLNPGTRVEHTNHSGLLEGLDSAAADAPLLGLASVASGCRHAIWEGGERNEG